MSNGNTRRPIARLTLRRDKVTYSILTVWPGRFAGTYDISRDKTDEAKKRIAIGLFDALKAWGSGDGYLSLSIESEREQRPRRDESGGGFGGNGNDDDMGIPF